MNDAYLIQHTETGEYLALAGYGEYKTVWYKLPDRARKFDSYRHAQTIITSYKITQAEVVRCKCD